MRKIGKNKHIGIYIHHQNREHWLRIKELLPYFSCKLTLLTSMDIRAELGDDCELIKLPPPEKGGYPSLSNQCQAHKKRMNIIFNFVDRECPDLFYIDESAQIATFVNLLGIPYVYARMKNARIQNERKNDFSLQLAYGLSLFNIADYDTEHEEDWYKQTPFYEKTKYQINDQTELNRKLFCMYLEEDFCLKKEEALKPILNPGMLAFRS